MSILSEIAVPAALDDLRAGGRERLAGSFEVAWPGGPALDQRGRAGRARPRRPKCWVQPRPWLPPARWGLTGPLGGQILLVFEDRSGLALVDLLLHQPIGTTTSWGELEQSAAQETTNIVGCAYLNALASTSAHGNGRRDIGGGAAAESSSPRLPDFLQEFAGSLLEFALMEQALELDQVLLVQSTFDVEPARSEPQLDAAVHSRPSLTACAGRRTVRA